MKKRKFSFYLLIYFSVLSSIMLLSTVWAYTNYESLLSAYELSEMESREANLKLSHLLIEQLKADISGQEVIAEEPDEIVLLTEPFYYVGKTFYLRKNGQYYEYKGDQKGTLLQLLEIKEKMANEVSSETLEFVKYSFVASIFLIFLIVIFLFLRLNKNLTGNMSRLVKNLGEELQYTSYSFEEFEHIEKEIQKFQTKALQTERQTVVSDVLSNWQIEVKKIIHDLKNPLQRIKLMLGNVAEKDANLALDAVEEIQRNLKEIRSADLVQEVDPKEIDIHSFFDRIRSLFYDIEIDLVVTQSQALEFDEYALQRVCSNLIQNAIEAGAKKLTFFFSTENGKSIIDVANDGDKINDPSKLFVPFSTTKKEGSGLGLVIILQFVHLHHGQIFLKHSTDTETMFRIELP